MSAWRRWTLRRRLVVGVAALVAAAFAISGVATVLALRSSLVDRLDEEVLVGLDVASGPSFADDGGPDGDGRGPEPRFGTLQVVLEDGEPRSAVYTSDVGAQRSLTETQLALLEAADVGERQPTTVDLGGELGTMRVAMDERGGTTVYSGISTADADATSTALGVIVTAVSIVVLLLLVLGIRWFVGRGLRPLERVAATAERVAERPLDVGAVAVPERVGTVDVDAGTEVGRVATSLDRLLAHVESALVARQASEERLRRFIADASHELRTPLASIRGYAQLSLAEDAPRTPTQDRALDRIESESQRMGALVEDLLLLARLDAGQPLRREPVDLTMLVIDGIGDAHAASPAHVWLVAVDEPVVVDGDEARLRQVLANLLGNARVHTPSGTTIEASAGVEGADAVVRVHDDGPGIAPELAERLFDRFSRGDDARSRAGGSTGLGLSISQAIVTAHGGALAVESRPGSTTFTMRLPLA